MPTTKPTMTMMANTTPITMPAILELLRPNASELASAVEGLVVIIVEVLVEVVVEAVVEVVVATVLVHTPSTQVNTRK
jgi:hypothetical protein